MEDMQNPLPIRPRSTTLDGSSTRLDADPSPLENRPPHSGRPSSSWLHRISTISSLNDSPSSSSRPGTPSISFSNNSNTPILPSSIGIISSAPPNKLVKRTLSHRTLSSSYTNQGTTSRPTFRRPATSHQRSATLRQLALDENQELSLPSQPQDTILPESEPKSVSQIWRPYFGSGYPKTSGAHSRKRYSSGLAKKDSLRTVNPSSKGYPTLLAATDITPRASEDERDTSNGRPFTRGSVQLDDSKAEPRSSNNLGRNSVEGVEPHRKARLSFSFGDSFMSSSPSTWKLSRTESLRKKKSASKAPDDRSISSPVAPMSTPSKREKMRTKLQGRRNVTDPAFFRPPKDRPQLDLTTTKKLMSFEKPPELLSPLPPLGRLSAFDFDLPHGSPTYGSTVLPESRSSETTSFQPNIQTFPTVHKTRQQRQSIANSDPSSTLMSSDGDTRVFTSGDEDSFQSDTAYDSIATRATASSNSGIRGHPLETVFDRSASPEMVREKLVPLETLIQGGSFSEAMSKRSSNLSAIDTRDEISTPVRPTMVDGVDQFSTPVQDDRRTASFELPSSPPSMAETQIHVEHSASPDKDVEPKTWLDDSEIWDETSAFAENTDANAASPQLPKHLPSEAFLHALHLRPKKRTSDEEGNAEKSKRLSIFEFAEPQKSDKDLTQGSKLRPKTVHGKDVVEGRGSRPAGRRGPSAVHLRSQSVPVNKEMNTENDQINPTSKYGTWGLGNKGPSEEWSDDFEFDEPSGIQSDLTGGLPNSSGSGTGLEVPQSIIDRQASVHGQFGQIQELTLFVEELRRLRQIAGSMGIISGSSRGLWEEAEGIVNLATIDEDHSDVLPPRSPTSPSFGNDPFEDETPTIPRDRNHAQLEESPRHRNSTSRRSISSPATPPIGRPRGESTAQAKSVLQTLYQSRGFIENRQETKVDEPRKLPFDTQDLRDLVIRAGVVTRALKEIVRKAEGITHSPDRPTRTPKDDDDSPLRKMFHPPHTSPTRLGLPKSPSASSYINSSRSNNTDADLTGRMQMMTVV
ncbi:MAG: hypothetical protein Q9227_008572 [Pyrenula ochraceoflavens]